MRIQGIDDEAGKGRNATILANSNQCHLRQFHTYRVPFMDFKEFSDASPPNPPSREP